MATLIIKQILGEAATPKNVAMLFAVITILLVAIVMYFASKDCGVCAFTMLKYFFFWGLGAAFIGYLVGTGVQASSNFGMANMAFNNVISPQLVLRQGNPVNFRQQ